jgi:hypothetical protein
LLARPAGTQPGYRLAGFGPGGPNQKLICYATRTSETALAKINRFIHLKEAIDLQESSHDHSMHPGFHVNPPEQPFFTSFQRD